jgi:hypothetical protein
VDFTSITYSHFLVVGTLVMLCVSFASLSSVVHHAFRYRTMVYWRLVIAQAVMSAVYFCHGITVSHMRLGYNPEAWQDYFIRAVCSNLWPFAVLPTMFYTWQYYELVSTVAGSVNKCWFLARIILVFVTAAGLITVTLILDYYTTGLTWFAKFGHLNPSKLRNFKMKSE